MRILLVDPSSNLLPLIQAPLQSLEGLEFYCAPDGAAALEQARALGAIDALISDPFAEGLDGFHLQSEIRDFNPKLQTLFLTNADLSSHAHALDGATVLPLPIDPERLRAFIGSIRTPQARALPPLREGNKLGPFQLEKKVALTDLTQRFVATQSGLDRNVLITLLNPTAAQNPEIHAAFLAHAGAKARVVHPCALAVYEAGELEGRTYYASETLEAPSLQNALDSGQPLPLNVLLQIARSVANLNLHLDQASIAHRPLDASEILLPSRGLPRVANPAASFADPSAPNASRQNLTLLGQSLLRLLPSDAPPDLRTCLERTLPDHPHPILSFDPFLRELHLATHPASHPGHASFAPASKNRLFPVLLTLVLLLGGISIVVHLGGLPKFEDPNAPLLPPQIHVPAGDYLIGGPEDPPTRLKEFWIDQTEISVAQYARFLKWCETHPDQKAALVAEGLPKTLPPTPEGWSNWNAVFDLRSPTPEQQTQLQKPVTSVSWPEAHAFAKWAGRELPSAREWEAAARGSRGLRYPWGDDPYAAQANVQPENAPHHKGAPGPVHTQLDRSPLGTLGMAGNVAEWTATFPPPPKSDPPQKKAVLKGGHFATPLLPLDSAFTLAIGERKAFVGFRTVSHSAAPKP
jgi:formylglycine-generating enzyme required for sulfatase activity/CheY-like chemotaxis protein